MDHMDYESQTETMEKADMTNLLTLRPSGFPSHKEKGAYTHLATGPIILKISNNIASVTVLSSSPTYRLAPDPGWLVPEVEVG